MIKAIFSKLMWVSRGMVWLAKGTSILVGLTVMIALTAGVVSTATAANGGNFILGNLNNAATAITKLTANIANPALQLVNTSTSTGATALNLQTATSKPPMTVNSSTKVPNLNADKVDGKDAPVWAVIRADGLAASWYGLTGNRHANGVAGLYFIDFNRDISKCAITATLATGNPGQISAYKRGASSPTSVDVYTFDYQGSLADNAFDLVVNC